MTAALRDAVVEMADGIKAWNQRVTDAGYGGLAGWSKEDANRVQDAMVAARRAVLKHMDALKRRDLLSENMAASYENVRIVKQPTFWESWFGWVVPCVGRARADLKLFKDWGETASGSHEKMGSAADAANMLAGVDKDGHVRGVHQQILKRLKALMAVVQAGWWGWLTNPSVRQGYYYTLSAEQLAQLSPQERADYEQAQRRQDEQNERWNQSYKSWMQVLGWVVTGVSLLLAVVTLGASIAAAAAATAITVAVIAQIVVAAVAVIAAVISAVCQYQQHSLETNTQVDSETRQRWNNIYKIVGLVSGFAATLAGMIPAFLGTAASKAVREIVDKVRSTVMATEVVGVLLTALLALKNVFTVKNFMDVMDKAKRFLGLGPADPSTFGTEGDHLDIAASIMEGWSAVQQVGAAKLMGVLRFATEGVELVRQKLAVNKAMQQVEEQEIENQQEQEEEDQEEEDTGLKPLSGIAAAPA